MANDNLVTNARIVEFSTAAILLSFFHWLTVTQIVKLFGRPGLDIPFIEFFFSATYLWFLFAMIVMFFIVEELYRRILDEKQRNNVIARWLMYVFGLVVSVVLVLKEPFSLLLLVASGLKVVVTILLLER